MIEVEDQRLMALRYVNSGEVFVSDNTYFIRTDTRPNALRISDGSLLELDDSIKVEVLRNTILCID